MNPTTLDTLGLVAKQQSKAMVWQHGLDNVGFVNQMSASPQMSTANEVKATCNEGGYDQDRNLNMIDSTTIVL